MTKVARHPTALAERRYRCYLPVLAGFTRLSMHGTWPRRKVGQRKTTATPIFPEAICRHPPSRAGGGEFVILFEVPSAAGMTILKMRGSAIPLEIEPWLVAG
jgi:hypothetical protein